MCATSASAWVHATGRELKFGIYAWDEKKSLEYRHFREGCKVCLPPSLASLGQCQGLARPGWAALADNAHAACSP